MSPTLFIYFINDLHSVFDNTCDPVHLDNTSISSLSFADDLVILSESQAGLQNSLNKLEKYCYKWQLTVNTNKTKIKIFQGSNHSYSNFFYKNLSLAEVKEYNFLGNIIDNKGRFKRSAQELSKKGLKAFFSLKKYLSEFLHVPVELSCKLFDSLIRPIILYNSEIWYMEDYYYIYKAENRSKAHGSNCDKLSFVDRFSFEKLHHKFCKAVLGIKKTSCNISAKSELGRLPLDSFIKTQVMLYYSRIQSDGINPLVKEAFNINKNISNENIYTWYTFATEIFKEVELNKNNFEDFNKPFLLVKDTFKNTFKKTIKEKYLKKYQT